MKSKQHLYEKIMDYVKEKINNRELLPYQQLPTELELAEQFEVSRITSKRALAELEKEGLIKRERGKGSFVQPQSSLDTRKAEADFSALSSKTISLIVPCDPNNKPLDYIIGAHDALMSKGYYLNVHTCGSSETARDLLQSLPQEGVKGIIYYPVHDNDNIDVIHSLYMNEYPIVAIDKQVPVPISYVVSDNFAGGQAAVSHLLDLGHTRIAYVTPQGIDFSASGRERYFGYCQGLKEGGIKVDTDLVFLELKKEIGLYASKREMYISLAHKLLQLEVTAVQVVNDITAIELIKACSEAGIRIPEQLSVVGFDDLEISRHLDIPITSIAQDFAEIGRMAAEIVVASLESPFDTQQKIRIPVELKQRQSSGPLGKPLD